MDEPPILEGSATTHHFKHVTRENWLVPDPLSSSFVQLDHRDGSITPMDGADWIGAVESIRVAQNVPLDVANAFEFTKGGLGYGYFYYSLATLVGQQMLRVADFAVDRFFVSRAIAPRPQSFARRLGKLRSLGLLTPQDFQRWDASRHLRNSATHPDFQHLWLPADAIRMFKLAAEVVSSLAWPIEAGAGNSSEEPS